MQPSHFSSSPSAAVPVDGPVRAGDASSILVGSGIPPVRSTVSLEDLKRLLIATGIATDVEVTYRPGPALSNYNQNAIIITGYAADDWPSASAFCAEVLKLIAATGYVLDLNQLVCTVTPTAPAMPKIEVPGWLLLLLLGVGLWWLWKNRD